MGRYTNRIRPIYQIDLESWQVIKEYRNVSVACEELGLTSQNIRNVCYGFNKQAGGYYWCYKDEWEEYYED